MLISVVIAEDHELTRNGLCTLLETKLEARIDAATGDGREVIPLLEEHDPDLLVLDLGLPGLNGLDVLHKLQKRALSVTVVVLSMESADAYVSEALQNGASGYVLKGSSPKELLNAIRAAVNGRTYLDEGLPDSLSPASSEEVQARYSTLTDREREVLQLTAEGLTSKEIGHRLSISPRTADKHRQNLKSKLGLRNAAELTRFFLEHSPSNQPNSPEE